MSSRRPASPPLIRAIGGGLAVLLVASVWYVTLAPSRFGGPLTPVLVRGVSMEPTYATGDLVLAYRGSPRVGDVVAYRHPQGAVVIHRLVEVTDQGLVTQGDNVATVDPWVVAPQDVLGTARLVVPGFADRLSWVTTPGVSAGLAGAVAFMVVLIPSPAERRWRAVRVARKGAAPRRGVTIATLAVVATLAPVAGAAAVMLVQAFPFTHMAFDAADVCTYNDNGQNTCDGTGNGGGKGGGGGNGGGGGGTQPPGRP